MADHFLTKTTIDLNDCIEVDGVLALDKYPALRQVLQDKASPEVAELFAEPLLSRGNDAAAATVSWYSDVEGEGTPLTKLDKTARGDVEAALSRDLASLRPLLDDPDGGRLVGAALHISDLENVWVVRGRPVILNWGMYAAGTGRDTAARTSQFSQTLGRFLPLAAAPPLTAAEQKDRPAAPSENTAQADPAGDAGTAGAAETASAARQTATAAAMAQPVHANPQERTPARGGWIAPLVLLLLFGLILLWLLLPGTRLFPAAPVAAVSDEAAVALTDDVNRALRERVATLKAAIEGAQCRADGTLLLPEGRTIEGLLPSDPENPEDGPGTQVEGSVTPMLPPDPARVEVPGGTGPEGATLSNLGMLDLLEERTVLVIAAGATESQTGSGFFIGPDSIITNFHVVDGATDIYVINHALGGLQAARMVHGVGPFSETSSDLALLRVPGQNRPHYTLYRSDDTLRLQSVIAAGFPGDVLETDAVFAALQAGDPTATPDLTVTDGVVNAEQSLSDANRVLLHSAPISQGNSGGPLVDLCGRVVGVNTFVRRGNVRTLNFALATDDLIGFLDGTGVTPDVVTQPCRPSVARPSPPPSETAEVQAPNGDDPTPSEAGDAAPGTTPPATEQDG